MCGRVVRSIAKHNPSISKNRFSTDFYHDAYAPEYTKAYYSDSCGEWRDSFIDKFNDLPARIQLLTHPIYWGEEHENKWDKLDSLRDNSKNINYIEEVKSIWLNR